MNQDKRSERSKADFMSSCGIEAELAQFVEEFIKSPEKFLSISIEKRREIENQMDAILSSFDQ